ncbi:VOC family protein [Ramlibacter tataouinensis]|uniref:VOC family protein n=1 Tax=Ramlibacter tataouinensis TaxID=94132 RepID=UPI0022F3A4E8|nr:VOC family protein [Ramlibacter tataouinensis]WBY03667.1 VOC family protein [Ramlibacter tataouinensis]
MTIHLDHVVVHSQDRIASARKIAELLGVPWSANGGPGPFSAVYVSDTLTLDFDEMQEPFPVGHFAFQVPPERFDQILGRLQAAGIAWRSRPDGPADRRVGSHGGGRLVYWDEPRGHIWEILTVSYARAPAG